VPNVLACKVTSFQYGFGAGPVESHYCQKQIDRSSRFGSERKVSCLSKLCGFFVFAPERRRLRRELSVFRHCRVTSKLGKAGSSAAQRPKRHGVRELDLNLTRILFRVASRPVIRRGRGLCAPKGQDVNSRGCNPRNQGKRNPPLTGLDSSQIRPSDPGQPRWG
jgi:hypothetical protein